jgi:phosphonoacetaldehyde hydrolase
LRVAVFDISGTILDYGCRGPVAAFVELFARHGVKISPAEARGPMGLHKRDHIRTLLADAKIHDRWVSANKAPPLAETLDELCLEFAPLQAAVALKYHALIPGVVEVVNELREKGIKIANTTGFESSMIKGLIPLAIQQGYHSDLWVCPDQVGQGRPAPWMMYHIAQKLGIYPMSTFVKVGDTPADIAEGHAAGAWVVAVVNSGNEVGCSEAALAALPRAKRKAKILAAKKKLTACSPHYVIETVADLLPVIDHISERIEKGETPRIVRRRSYS